MIDSSWGLVPGAFVVYLGFDAGGYFAGTTGLAAAIAAVLLCVRLLTSRLAGGLSRSGTLALAAGGLYAAWTLASALWSHAPALAAIEFDRALLYLLIVAIFATSPSGDAYRMLMAGGVLAGVAVVCGAGLLSRILPHLVSAGSSYDAARLSYPVTYWNVLGMLAGIGVICCLYLASAEVLWLPLRALATGLIPGLVCTLLLTFSRGAAGATLFGVFLYALLVPSAGLFGTLLAAAPFAAIAAVLTYQAKQLASGQAATPAGISQGHRIALAIVACAVAAMVVRGLLGILERRLSALPRRGPSRRGARVLLATVATAVLVVLIGSGWLGREAHRFATENVVNASASRLTSVGNNGRLALWRVALAGFRSSPIHGVGAGTYALTWNARRSIPVQAQDAHSLYLQTLDELGIVGLVALLVFLVALLVGATRRMGERVTHGFCACSIAVLAAVALQSAVDWDWQMPVVFVPTFALLAAAGRPTGNGLRSHFRIWVRIPAGICVLALGAAPAAMAISQLKLDAGLRAFDRGDCRSALASAAAAKRAMPIRPEPYELIGYCDLYNAQPRLALLTMRRAVSLEPEDWEFHYALALATAGAGGDPRAQLYRARALNPLGSLTSAALAAFDRTPRRRWPLLATQVPIDVP